ALCYTAKTTFLPGKRSAHDLARLVVDAISCNSVGDLLGNAARVRRAVVGAPAGLDAGIEGRSVPITRREIIDASRGLVARIAVFLLQRADELVALTGDMLKLIVGHIAPLLTHFALKLFPVSLYGIPVHG